MMSNSVNEKMISFKELLEAVQTASRKAFKKAFCC